MLAEDGKMRLADVADAEQMLRVVQLVPSKRLNPLSGGCLKLVVSVLMWLWILSCLLIEQYRVIGVWVIVKIG